MDVLTFLKYCALKSLISVNVTSHRDSVDSPDLTAAVPLLCRSAGLHAIHLERVWKRRATTLLRRWHSRRARPEQVDYGTRDIL